LLPDTEANLLNELPAHFLLNAGVRAPDVAGTGIELGVHVYNVLAHRYSQGGSTRYPYPQPGRWFLATVGYRLRP
jgi:hypothetical protein